MPSMLLRKLGTYNRRSLLYRGLSQISGVDGSSGMTVNFALRFGATHDPECNCGETEASVQGRL